MRICGDPCGNGKVLFYTQLISWGLTLACKRTTESRYPYLISPNPPHTVPKKYMNVKGGITTTLPSLNSV